MLLYRRQVTERIPFKGSTILGMTYHDIIDQSCRGHEVTEPANCTKPLQRAARSWDTLTTLPTQKVKLQVPWLHSLPFTCPVNYLLPLRYRSTMPSSKGNPTDPELRQQLKEGKLRYYL